MDHKSRTLQYYSHWLGQPDILLDTPSEVHFLQSNERDHIQPGYPQAFSLYLWVEANRVIVSYGKKAKDGIPALRLALGNAPALSQIEDALQKVYGKKPSHSVKFWLDGCRIPSPDAVTVTKAADYLTFFQSQNPCCKDLSWVSDYFDEMAAEDLCCGIYQDGRLVSCTDAPLVPYLADCVTEIGVNTLSAYRQKGYAAQAAARCVQNLLLSGKTPIWSCDAKNLASIKTAEKTGFQKLSDVFTISL